MRPTKEEKRIAFTPSGEGAGGWVNLCHHQEVFLIFCGESQVKPTPSPSNGGEQDRCRCGGAITVM
ncbi:hypothetical protein [Prochlorothrix hollandica]